jgi:hypothetical protein
MENTDQTKAVDTQGPQLSEEEIADLIAAEEEEERASEELAKMEAQAREERFSMEESTGPNLFRRLLTIMEEAGSVQKGGYNEFDKYSYIAESDLAKHMQKLFVKHGVFVTSSVVGATTEPCKTSKGTPAMLSKVTMKYLFVNVDNPIDNHTVYAAGDGIDRGDKAIYKALTGAHKYFLIRNFNLGSDEDAEKDSHAVGSENGSAKPSSVPAPTPAGNTGVSDPFAF